MDPQYETVELEGDSVLKSFSVTCALLQDDHSWHYHPECELTYVIKGEGTRFVGDDIQHFGPGDLVFCAPNLPHCWANDDGEQYDPDRNDLLVLQFKPDCLGADFLISPDAKAMVELVERGKRGLQYSGPVVEEVAGALRRLQGENGLARIATFAHLLHLLATTQTVSQLSSALYVNDTRGFHGGRMKVVADYVKENLHSEIKQSDLATLVSMTPQGFSRFFRATTGRTFVSFVNMMRIMEACRLLINTEDDVVDIAFQCGYANLSNFNRRFADLKKTTPSDYRYQHSRLEQKLP